MTNANDNSLRSSSRTRGTGFGLNCLVFVTGAAVMILEVVGTRLISPYFGVTLYVWTALIFVTLLSLAAGYYCGGALADRNPGLKLTLQVTIAAATVILLIPIAAPVVLPFTNSWGVRWGTLASAVVLFGPPLFLLAMVGPCAVKVRTADLSRIGFSVGSLYGISTVGSCVGTLLAAYVLIPSMQTYAIFYSLSITLAFVAAFCLMIARITRESVVAAIVLAIGFAKVATSSDPAAVDRGDLRLLFRANSIYGKVQVLDDDLRQVRWLMSDCSVVGAEYPKRNATLYPFLRMIEAVRYLNPAGIRALAIGLGTGVVPKALETAGIQTDVVEIDPNVAQAASDFFGFKPNGTLYLEDGRRFLNRANQKYDFIIHDTFTGGTVPFHLLSRQVFEDARRILNEDGVFCLVFVGYFTGDKALPARAIFTTLMKVYPHVRVIADPHDPSRPSNLLFFASGKPLDWQPALWSGLSKGTRERLAKQQITLLPSDKNLISDERNPLDLWQADKHESYRKWILEQFPAELLIN